MGILFHLFRQAFGLGSTPTRETRRAGRQRFRFRPQVEPLEGRDVPAIIFNQGGLLADVGSTPGIDAKQLTFHLNGVGTVQGNTLTLSQDVDPTAGFDFRQFATLNTNADMRTRHLDGETAGGQADKFGATIKASMTMVTETAGTPAFFLSNDVSAVNLVTTDARLGRVVVVVVANPADAASALQHTNAPVTVQTTLTFFTPLPETPWAAPRHDSITYQAQVLATVDQTTTLSQTHTANAEALREIEFRSSNVPASNTSQGVATNDSDQLRVTDATGADVANVNLTTAPTNQLLFSGGQTVSGTLQLNKNSPGPLNGDPPSFRTTLLAGSDPGEVKAQAFISLNGSTNENSDNLAAFAGRVVSNRTLQAGTELRRNYRVEASDHSLVALSAAQRFVQLLYSHELGRVGSTAELDAWVDAMIRPGGSRLQVAEGIAGSLEARARLVRHWYRAYLSRSPANGEEQGWVQQLAQGGSEEGVQAGILASAEFAARANALVASGTNDERYVSALYQLLVRRVPTAQEVSGWVTALPAQGRNGVAQGFLRSVEYRNAVVGLHFQQFLHRRAESAGLAAWVNSGNGLTGLRTGIGSSQEFFANG